MSWGVFVGEYDDFGWFEVLGSTLVFGCCEPSVLDVLHEVPREVVWACASGHVEDGDLAVGVVYVHQVSDLSPCPKKKQKINITSR